MRIQIPENNKDEYLSKLVLETVDRWEKYKDDFFIKNDPEAILKASFALGYFLFVLEFLNETPDRILSFSSANNLKTNINTIKTLKRTRANLPGFDYLLRENNRPAFLAAMLLKRNLLDKTYSQLEDGMIDAIRQKTDKFKTEIVNKAPNGRMSEKEVFKYTGYESTSYFTNVFFFHSMVMFGWYMFYGYFNSRSRGTVIKDFPGSCNVQGCINMYLFKKAGILDKIVYIPHGRDKVSSVGAINSMTARRASGTDDVQFCHHAFKLIGEVQNHTSGYYGNHMVKVMRSHVDAFDVLTLTPIFRCIQRLKRTGKGDRVKYITDLLEIVNTDIKTFLVEHRMSNLPGNAQYVSKQSNIVHNMRSNKNIKWRNQRMIKLFMNDVLNAKERSINISSLKSKYTNFNLLNRSRIASSKIPYNLKNNSNIKTYLSALPNKFTDKEIDIAIKMLKI